jgi:hypothetical protein
MLRGIPILTRVRSWPTATAVALALVLASAQYRHYLDAPRGRWNSPHHDRHSHYAYAQELALALRNGEPLAFFGALEKSKAWPPLHGLAATAILTPAGPDYRMAVLPSAAGFALTIVFAFLLAHRFGGPYGLVAGVAAAAFVAASPAHRAFATDAMLESLGAGLTLAALFAIVLAFDRGSAVRWRASAIVLTLLFFEKYNYWLLVVLAAGLAGLTRLTPAERRAAWTRVRGFEWAARIRAGLREPVTYGVAAVMALPAVVFATGPGSFKLAGMRLSLYPPRNLITLAYAALVSAIALDRRRMTGWMDATRDSPVRPLLTWHLVPVGASFLLPGRLAGFAGFVGPFHTGERPDVGGLAFYGRAAAVDYHEHGWIAAACLGAGLLAVWLLRADRSARLLFIFLLVSAALTLLHPNQKSRFLHSWIPSLWCLGAAGTVLALDRLRSGALATIARRGAVSGIAAAAAMAIAAEAGRPGRSDEVGHRGETASLLDVSDAYLGRLSADDRLAVFANAPAGPWVDWTYRERTGRLAGVEWITSASTPPGDIARAFDAWRQRSSATAVAILDFPDGAAPGIQPAWNTTAARDVTARLEASGAFSRTAQWTFPDIGCEASLWTRRTEPVRPARNP